MIKTFQKLSFDLKALLAGYGLCRGFYFATWPFIAIILARKYLFTATQIGILFCLCGLFAALIGVYAGSLSDRIGRKKALLSGVLSYALAFFIFGLIDHVWAIFIGVLFVAIGKSVFEPLARAYLSDQIQDEKLKVSVFYLLQYILNLAAAIGPVVFSLLGLEGNLAVFAWTGIVFAVFASFLTMVLKTDGDIRQTDRLQPYHSKKVVLSDISFMLFVMSCFVMLLPYAQLESVISLHLNHLFDHEAGKLFAFAISTNALTVLVAQPFFEKAFRAISADRQLLFGCIPYFFSFFGLSWVDVDSLSWLYVSMVFFSIGESILFPVLQVKVDALAPKKLRGTYFAVYHNAWLAFAFGPLIWGIVMDALGGSRTLALGAFLAVPAITLYLLSLARLKEASSVAKSVAG